ATWWYLERVCEIIYGKKIQPGFKLADVATLLLTSLPMLTQYLGPQFNQTRRLIELRRTDGQ
ncbi:MAG: hypothetical protein KGS61_13765, partial [Verrucomicrobia bacterium]|nr:hypothetical protein [Verrucomicrobiota bacterium]